MSNSGRDAAVSVHYKPFNHLFEDYSNYTCTTWIEGRKANEWFAIKIYYEHCSW